MRQHKRYNRIPTQMCEGNFNEFILPHLTRGKSGPPSKITLHKIFNYILKFLHSGCQWENLPIDRDSQGKPEIHYTRVFRIFKRWLKDGCFDRIFVGSVAQLLKKNY